MKETKFDEFIEILQNLKNIDVGLVKRISQYNTLFLQSNKFVRKETIEGQLLQKKWYDALAKGNPDYTVYENDYYLGELWACWQVYSSRHLKNIQNPKSLIDHSIIRDIGKIKTIVDLGCGFGITSAYLKTRFPEARVIATNLINTKQGDVAKIYAKKYGFELVDELDLPKIHADLIFASEYFEHILCPIIHLEEILTTFTPRTLLIASSFGAKAIGHFDEYRNMDLTMEKPKEISRHFNQFLRSKGYKKIETKLWNNRPAYWKYES